MFNGFGNLLSASAGAAKEEFRYDAFGRRFAETDSGNTTFLLWDGPRLAALMPKGHPEQSRIGVGTGPDGILALADGLGKESIYFLHAGLDGSTLAATDRKSNLIEVYRY